MALPKFLQSFFGSEPKADVELKFDNSTFGNQTGAITTGEPAAILPSNNVLSPEQLAGAKKRAKVPEAQDSSAPLAPWPSIDRYPVILGSNVTLTYISNTFRMCLTGYRREYCDLLDELLERDPHVFAVVAQRVHAVVGGRVQVSPGQTEEGTPEEKRAQELADYVEHRIGNIPDWQRAMSQLQWGGLYYGVGALEIHWEIDKDGLYPEKLHWIHSRRLNYPDPGGWSVRVWDQGAVTSWQYGADPTGQMFGIRCEDFPGHFIVHTPAPRGNYPTRDGLGRQTAYWSALKLMGARGASQYIERFGKPWVAGYYATGEEANKPRPATDQDIKILESAATALGVGSLSGATLPDSTKLDIFGPAANTPGRQLFHAQFVTLCNSEISKAVLGQTDTTEPGANGSRGATKIRKEGTKELYRYDSTTLADTLERDLVRWIIRGKHDYTEADDRLMPHLIVHAGEEPDLDSILERAVKAATAGAPVDADAVCQAAGIPLLPKLDPEELLANQVEQDKIEDDQAKLNHDAAQQVAEQNHNVQQANQKAMVEAQGGKHLPSKFVPAPFVPTLRPERKLDTKTGRRMFPMAMLKPYEFNDLLKLDKGVPVTAPPKLLPPTAEAGPGAAVPVRGAESPPPAKIAGAPSGGSNGPPGKPSPK